MYKISMTDGSNLNEELMYEWQYADKDEATNMVKSALNIQWQMAEYAAKKIAVSAMEKFTTRNIGLYVVATIDEISLVIESV